MANRGGDKARGCEWHGRAHRDARNAAVESLRTGRPERRLNSSPKPTAAGGVGLKTASFPGVWARFQAGGDEDEHGGCSRHLGFPPRRRWPRRCAAMTRCGARDLTGCSEKRGKTTRDVGERFGGSWYASWRPGEVGEGLEAPRCRGGSRRAPSARHRGAWGRRRNREVGLGWGPVSWAEVARGWATSSFLFLSFLFFCFLFAPVNKNTRAFLLTAQLFL